MIKAQPVIEIDETSGFCSGVNRAIRLAEKKLEQSGQMHCLGRLIHNDRELERLNNLGMSEINHDDLGSGNATVFIRTHGEPPETYNLLNETKRNFLDATCPYVLRLQQKVRESSLLLNKSGKGKVVIFGKPTHPEIIGLLGQTSGNAIVVGNNEDAKLLDFSEPMHIYAQTTADEEDYNIFCRFVTEFSNKQNAENNNIVIHNTICRQMSRRVPALIHFAKRNDVIIFVSGHDSSNGKYLAAVLSENNPRTHVVENSAQIGDWFKETDRIGISGATSTPYYQLKEVADFISDKFITN